MLQQEVTINITDASLPADITIPDQARGMIIFAYPCSNNRNNPRTMLTAELFHNRNMATLVTDLLTPVEDELYENRYNIPLLSKRLICIAEWALQQPELMALPVAYFGAGAGAAAALQAAVLLDSHIKAVISRGGHPDLAGPALQNVKVPTLLIIGSLDTRILDSNKKAFELLAGEKKMEFVQNASHLFDEPGALHKVVTLTADWINQFIAAS